MGPKKIDIMAFHTRFYYDSADGKCKLFTYGGCGGNGNRFDTEVACLEACAVAPETNEI